MIRGLGGFLSVGACVVGLAMGCGDDGRRVGTDTPTDTPPGTDGGLTGRDFGPRAETDGCNKMDILFVIDDSGSMGEEQANLAANFPRFVEILDAYRTEGGNPLDYRLGVTTTGKDFVTVINFGGGLGLPPMEIAESGPNGALQQECGMTRRWIESADADVATTFSCVAEVGTGGSSVEMPLLMTEMALTARVSDGTNTNFLRPDALLAVVMLTDEDDCSLLEDRVEITLDPLDPAAMAADECDPSRTLPVSRFIDVLDGVKGDRGRWAGAIIAGPGPGSCTSSFGDALEATRLQEFANSAGDNVIFSSICEGDLSGALMNAIETFEAACQSFPPLI